MYVYKSEETPPPPVPPPPPQCPPAPGSTPACPTGPGALIPTRTQRYPPLARTGRGPGTVGSPTGPWDRTGRAIGACQVRQRDGADAVVMALQEEAMSPPPPNLRDPPPPHHHALTQALRLDLSLHVSHDTPPTPYRSIAARAYRGVGDIAEENPCNFLKMSEQIM